eukprot:snap_masked-scaffold329_size204955-processed-gene-0.0 protein:Tk00264 transcript:snap_masked-scaffold329_size204955-processed-gene-0.0-mRNA-1 annotation:"Spz1"
MQVLLLSFLVPWISAEAESKAEAGYPQPAPHYSPASSHYGQYPPPPYTLSPAYGNAPSYPQYGHQPRQGYAPQPAYPLAGAAHVAYDHPPSCSKGNPKPYCLVDPEYPTYEVQQAVEYHYDTIQQLYKDVLVDTKNSVDRLRDIVEETYLCPSEVKYIQPLRALNVHGKWRIVVNHVQAHYETLTQTARLEHCAHPGTACPLIPECYQSKCIQKNIFHRFMVYEPTDKYLPFSLDSFQLPSACACYSGRYDYSGH